ncbi:MAG: hypothetical protein C4305_03825 [Thermoleophilia bacterium]
MKGKLTLAKILEVGGIVSAIVLVAFGVTAIVLGADGRSTVQSNLAQEYIVGTPDMTPTGIVPAIEAVKQAQKKLAAARAKAGADPIELTEVEAPRCSVAGKLVNNGDRARCFAQYMRIHALEGTSGLVYAQMGRYLAKPDAPPKATDFNGGTNDPKYAVTDPKTGQPVSNGARNVWVTETALASALNLAYTAEQVSTFGIVVGVALLLSGIGFAILAVAAFHQRVKAEEKERAGVVLRPTTAR